MCTLKFKSQSSEILTGSRMLTFTLPSFRTDAGEALIVLRLLTQSSMLAGFGAAGGHQGFTVLSCNTHELFKIK